MKSSLEKINLQCSGSHLMKIVRFVMRFRYVSVDFTVREFNNYRNFHGREEDSHVFVLARQCI